MKLLKRLITMPMRRPVADRFPAMDLGVSLSGIFYWIDGFEFISWTGGGKSGDVVGAWSPPLFSDLILCGGRRRAQRAGAPTRRTARANASEISNLKFEISS